MSDGPYERSGMSDRPVSDRPMSDHPIITAVEPTDTGYCDEKVDESAWMKADWGMSEDKFSSHSCPLNQKRQQCQYMVRY